MFIEQDIMKARLSVLTSQELSYEILTLSKGEDFLRRIVDYLSFVSI